MRKFRHDRIERLLNTGQFVIFDRSVAARRITTQRAAYEQRLVPGGQRMIIASVEFILRRRLGGKRGGGEKCGCCEGMSDHPRLVARLKARAKQKSREVSLPAPLVS